MAHKVPFKEVSRVVRDMHNSHGQSIVSLALAEPVHPQGLALVDMTDERLQVPGDQLTRKQVGKFLFDCQRNRSMQRLRGVIWTFIGDNTSIVGIGVLVDPKKAQRTKRDFVVPQDQSEGANL